MLHTSPPTAPGRKEKQTYFKRKEKHTYLKIYAQALLIFTDCPFYQQKMQVDMKNNCETFCMFVPRKNRWVCAPPLLISTVHGVGCSLKGKTKCRSVKTGSPSATCGFWLMWSSLNVCLWGGVLIPGINLGHFNSRIDNSSGTLVPLAQNFFVIDDLVSCQLGILHQVFTIKKLLTFNAVIGESLELEFFIYYLVCSF